MSNKEFNKILSESRANRNPNNAVLPLIKTLQERTILNDSLKAVLFLELGVNYGKLFLNDTATYYLSKALQLVKPNPWPLLGVEVYNSMGNLARNLSLNELALQYYDSGLNALGKLSTRERFVIESKLLANIGGIHYDLAEYDKSMEYAERGTQVVLENELHERIKYCYLTIAFAARALGQHEKALVNNKKALKIMEEESDSSLLAYTIYNIAHLQMDQGQFDSAMNNFGKALVIAEKFKEEETAVSCMIAQGQILNHKRRYREALNIVDEVILRSEKKRFLPKIVEALKVKYQALIALSNWMEASRTQERFIQYKDSLFNIESREKLANIEIKYETEIKEQQIKELRQANAIKDLEAESARQWRIGLTVFLGLLFIVVVMLYNRYQLKQRSERALDEKNKELNQLNGLKDRLFAIISHDLKSPLSSFHTLTTSLSQNFDRISKEDLASYIEELSNSSKDLYDMLNNLLEWAISQTGSKSFMPSQFNVQLLSEELIQQMGSSTRLKSISIIDQIDENCVVFADRSMIQIVLRNLLANAIKFSNEKSLITLISELQNGWVTIQVKDKGVGISNEDVQKLFRTDTDVQSVGAGQVSKGTGIGLLLCKELVNKNGGEISVESVLGEGSIFYITLPIAPVT